MGAPEDRLLWTSTKCPFKRDVYLIESQIKRSKESQDPTLGVVFSEVSVERVFCLQIFFLTVFRFLPKVGMLFFNNNFLFIIA